MPAWVSKAIEYWNPEQPPPTTPMRSPAGSGSWVAMISRTFAIACGVRIRGACLTVSVCGAAVVAMSFLRGGISGLTLMVQTLTVQRPSHFIGCNPAPKVAPSPYAAWHGLPRSVPKQQKPASLHEHDM